MEGSETRFFQCRRAGRQIGICSFLLVAMILALLFAISSASADWSTSIPDAVYITKMQYRYRTRITKESASNSEEGWTLYQEVPGSWSDWISNGTTPLTGSLDFEVRTVNHPEVTTVTGYSYRRYKYYNSSNGSNYLTYGENWANSHGYSGSWQYTTVSSPLPEYKNYDGVQSYGSAGDFWFYPTENRTVTQAAYIEYQYRTRSRTYILSKWTEWSQWQDEAIISSESIDVETRTLYAPNSDFLPSTILVGRELSVTLVAGTACQLRYSNNEAGLNWLSTNPDVAAVDPNGYLSAYNAGTTTVSVGGKSIEVLVVSSADMMFPSGINQIENSAFEGDMFTSVDIRNASIIGEKAFANDTRLKLAILNGQAAISGTAFEGSNNVVIASVNSAPNTSLPYYVLGRVQNYIAVSSVELNQSSVTIAMGRDVTLTATVLPENATNPRINWSSSNAAVATVSSNGKVIGLTEGTSVITASANNGKKATCTVTVTPVYVSSISLNYSNLSIIKGRTATLSATVQPSDSTNKNITWNSSNSAVATVNTSGTVNAISEGTAIITATAADGHGATAQCTVTVTPTTVAGDGYFTSINAESITTSDATIRFKFSVSPNPTEGGFYFGTSSSNLSLVKSESYIGHSNTVNNVFFNINKYWGTLSANTTYYYRVYYVYDGVTYNSAVHSFTTLQTASISPTSGSYTVGQNEALQLSVTASPSGASVSWSSSNSAIASVNSSGLVTGVSGGSVTITATASANGTSATASFTVTVNPIEYHVLLIVNYRYSKSQVMEWYNVLASDFNDWMEDHDFLGIWDGGGKWTPSPAKVNDGEGIARAYRAMATRKGVTPDVHMYTDISKSSVLSLIPETFGSSDYNDVNLFYYGGHGASTAEMYLQSGETIAPVNLAGAFRNIQGRNIVLASCCYSGGFAHTMTNYPYATISGIAACSASEYSWSKLYGGTEYSLDTYNFLKGIGFNGSSTMYADSNGDGKVTLGEIANYMNNGVSNDASSLGVTQHLQQSIRDSSIIIYQR